MTGPTDLVIVVCVGGDGGNDRRLDPVTREYAERLVACGFFGSCDREHRIEPLPGVNMLRD